MNADPQVSVLMTAYNREQYIAAAIESVLAQKFTDFELVIIDDKSSDGTLAIAERYVNLDARVRVFANAANLGDYPNRNHAATLARGTLLKYHDSDDVMYPHCLQVMVPPLMEAPAAGLALTARGSWPGAPAPMALSPRLAYEREFLGSGMFMGGPACALFRRVAFETVGGFPEAGVHSDYLMWLAICARFPVVLTPGDLFWYRIHPQQELHTAGAGYDNARVHAHAWQALQAPECPLDGEALHRARRNVVALLIKHVVRDLGRGEWALASYRWRHRGMSLADLRRYCRPPHRESHAGTPLTAASKATVGSLLTDRTD